MSNHATLSLGLRHSVKNGDVHTLSKTDAWKNIMHSEDIEHSHQYLYDEGSTSFAYKLGVLTPEATR